MASSHVPHVLYMFINVAIYMGLTSDFVLGCAFFIPIDSATRINVMTFTNDTQTYFNTKI